MSKTFPFITSSFWCIRIVYIDSVALVAINLSFFFKSVIIELKLKQKLALHYLGLGTILLFNVRPFHDEIKAYPTLTH